MLAQGPEVQGVPFGSAGSVKTLENVLLQIHGERSSLKSRAIVMDRARTSPLRALALQSVAPLEFAENLLDRDLPAELREVDTVIARSGDRRRLRCFACEGGSWYSQWCRGDRLPFGTLSFAALGIFHLRR